MLLRTFIAGILLTAGAFAQVSSFPKPSYFRETFQSARTTVELKDPVKLRDFVVEGKLELSLKHYLELVMANNTDIQIQFLSVEIPKNAIQAAMGVWDPTTTSRFTTTRSTNAPTSPLDTTNVNSVLKSLNQPFSLTYQQTLDSGTQFTGQFNGSKVSSNASRSTYIKQFSTGLNFQVTQPLLRNRGRFVNRIPVMSAQSNLKVAEFSLRDRLLSLVNTAESAYWNVVAARETVVVQEKARDTAKTYLDFMQQQLDLGALSPLDIYNPKAALAQAEVSLSQAKFNLATAEDVLRHQLGADLDPDVRKLPISLTESVEPGPAESMAVEREQEVDKALANSPALKAATQRLDVDDLSIHSTKNALLPNLSFNGGYTTNGVGGLFDPNRTSLVGSGIGLLPLVPGGVTDALGQMFGFGYPTYVAGLTLQLPIRNRRASADYANSLIAKKQDALAVRNQQQNVRLGVLSSVTSLEGAKEQLKLAVINRDFARLNEKAARDKYELGTETNQNVVFAQRDLATAELGVVNAQISVRRSFLNLLTQTGELLDERGLVVKYTRPADGRGRMRHGQARMQTIVLALLLAAVFGLFVPSAQIRLRGMLQGSPRTIWAVPFLMAAIFAGAAGMVGVLRWELPAMVLAYAALPVACVSVAGAGKPGRTGAAAGDTKRSPALPAPTAWDFAAILLLWLPLEFAAGGSLVPRQAQGFLHSVAYGIAILLGLVLFLGFRSFEGLKYRVPTGARDWWLPLAGFAAVAPVLVVVGIAIGFLPMPHLPAQSAGKMAAAVGIVFAGTALPEEILFRALIQNFLMQRFGAGWRTLVVASVIFGAAHLDNGPQAVPNWRYFIEATIAGVAYGRVFQKAGSVTSSAMLHTMVDWTKHFFI